jgi:hypothetical protein
VKPLGFLPTWIERRFTPAFPPIQMSWLLTVRRLASWTELLAQNIIKDAASTLQLSGGYSR